MANNSMPEISKQWARANKVRLKAQFCGPILYPKQKSPVTIFMAGTPGAGKTEFSKKLLDAFGDHIVRIDADEIREMMREIGYNGANAQLYQDGVGIAVNNLYRSAIKQHQSVLIDGTFAFGGWYSNVEMSLNDKRIVEIYYLYQDPAIAWGYVKKREIAQGRVVPKQVFINDYRASIDNVCDAKRKFGNKVTIYYAKNNYEKRLEYVKVGVGIITDLLPSVYNNEELERIMLDDTSD